jgi:hypothetical protein
MAAAMAGGILLIAVAMGLMKAVNTIKPPAKMNAPTASENAMPETPVAINAAPGVDHATMMGCLYFIARKKDVAAMAKQIDAAAEACCVGVAPTARKPSITTKMVDAKPTTTAAVAAAVMDIQ